MRRHANEVCLVCVDVRSAHNIGSLFRTCDGFGAELYVVGASPRPAYKNDTRLPHVVENAEKQISKTALGAEKSVPWQYAETLVECINNLRKLDYHIVAIEQSISSRPMNSLHKQGKIALIVGRELEGLRQNELALCDAIHEIPMYGVKESLNVSVAAGIALYEVRR